MLKGLFITFQIAALFFTTVSAQEIDQDLYERVIARINLSEFDEEDIEAIDDTFIQTYAKFQTKLILGTEISSKPISRTMVPDNSPFKENLYHLATGDYLRQFKNKDSLIVSEYQRAYELAVQEDSNFLQNEALRRMCDYYFDTQDNIEALEDIVERYSQTNKEPFHSFYYNFYALGLQMQRAFKNKEDLDESLFEVLQTQASTLSNLKATGEAYQLTGAYYLLFKDDHQTSQENFDKASSAFNKIKSFNRKDKSLGIAINKSIVAYDNGDYNVSLKILDSLIGVSTLSNYSQEQLSVLQYLKLNYFKKDDFYKAYLFQDRERILKDSLNSEAHKIAISDLRTKYKTEEQEIENDHLKRRQTSILLASLAAITFLIVVSALGYKNLKRKQRIAEQNKELQIQKTEKVLKEKEIETINAMVSGQEKERQRLAGELHDNLGGTLAALKMHFNNIENTMQQGENPSGTLSKVNELLKDAYSQVRGIAHEKNSGVMAKDGLLPAIEKLAQTVSSSQGLKIEVQDFGLEDRLSNDLEITIFRIIQELVTNIIKHAQATEAIISLTQHDGELNIMVEDNGIGFKAGKLTDKNGMGLGSIERRVEHLEGAMAVDSSPGNGTSIIIDIPL